MTYSQKQFIEQAAPEFWYSYAHELADTADEIYKKSKAEWIGYVITHTDGVNKSHRRPLVSRPVLLMYGLSLENLIKGLLISQDPYRLSGGKLNKKLLGHDLLKLADRLKNRPTRSRSAELTGTAFRRRPLPRALPSPKNSARPKTGEIHKRGYSSGVQRAF